jgi:Spy/CpxP family protein refolding chaperone
VTNRGQFALAIVLAFGAAIGGAFIGRTFINAPPPVESELHQVLHDQLDLDPAQNAKIEAIEAQFVIRRQALELELRADNAQLASAIEAEHGYGAQVGAVVDRSHMAMGELQKATLEHIFAMRSVLRPDQARKFDEAIVKALTAQAR